jgi:hypothetical protein
MDGSLPGMAVSFSADLGLPANNWMFLLSHPWSGGVPSLGSNLWNANLAFHQRGRGGHLFGSPSRRVLIAVLFESVTQSFDNKFCS